MTQQADIVATCGGGPQLVMSLRLILRRVERQIEQNIGRLCHLFQGGLGEALPNIAIVTGDKSRCRVIASKRLKPPISGDCGKPRLQVCSVWLLCRALRCLLRGSP